MRPCALEAHSRRSDFDPRRRDDLHDGRTGAARNGLSVRKTKVPVWKSADGGYFIARELFTIAHSLTRIAASSGPRSWITRKGMTTKCATGLAQTVHRQDTPAASLKLSDDIRNISGATLSCRHVTETVKRLLATYDVALKSS